jgi:hypothetical protein
VTNDGPRLLAFQFQAAAVNARILVQFSLCVDCQRVDYETASASTTRAGNTTKVEVVAYTLGVLVLERGRCP